MWLPATKTRIPFVKLCAAFLATDRHAVQRKKPRQPTSRAVRAIRAYNDQDISEHQRRDQCQTPSGADKSLTNDKNDPDATQHDR